MGQGEIIIQIIVICQSMNDTPKSPIEKLYKTSAPIVLVIGIILTTLLFKGLLMFADQGNLFMVILMAVAISAVSFVLTKVITLSLRYKPQQKIK